LGERKAERETPKKKKEASRITEIGADTALKKKIHPWERKKQETPRGGDRSKGGGEKTLGIGGG